MSVNRKNLREKKTLQFSNEVVCGNGAHSFFGYTQLTQFLDTKYSLPAEEWGWVCVSL